MKMIKNAANFSFLSAALVVGAILAPTTASADSAVSASLGVSNFYLYRGVNLGNNADTLGTAAVSGSLDYSHASGAYAGVWASSGDANAGTEYDLYAGYALEIGDVALGAGVVNYLYPEIESGSKLSELTEAMLSVSGYGASASAWKTITGGGAWYYTLGYELESFSATLGMTDPKGEDGYSHLDLAYSIKDFTLTLSQVVDTATDDQEDDLLVNVSYSLAFDL
ncbi:TorF family putative porin [Pelagibaculum spongiae]|uniref:Histidine kinase n=1 Tax=Pelagibaculum spongiae TaxID=2080658 RepID=A0A2V1H0E3_9GAMM|nr:TorF family putative porin [Pelagibaculum spongiae]PVZ72129.1 histidine kinase [Pelagibaculum spongiae]